MIALLCSNRYEECERDAYSKGMCLKHYKRDWRRMTKYGTLDVPEMRGGYRFQTAISQGKHCYSTTHKQLARHLGKASEHKCLSCDEKATNWAYQHNSPFEKFELSRDGYWIAYSPRVVDYEPMCGSHHRQFDLEVKKSA